MKLDNLTSIDQIRDFLKGSQAVAFVVATSKDERYQFVERLLSRFAYSRLKRPEKNVVIEFLQKVKGYSPQQLSRMNRRYTEQGQLRRFQKTLNGFEQRYTAEDIRLLAQVDKRHDTPNGFMVKKLCERAYKDFKDQAYKRLSEISVAHIYNLRKSTGYIKHRSHYEKTKSPKCLHIGERHKPRSDGKPGYIRIDTVDQGDFDGCKGVYHINAVDEVPQYEIVVSNVR